MRRRFPAVLASFFLAAVVAPISTGVILNSPSVLVGKSPTTSNAKVLKSPTGTVTAGRRWN